ncbi:hypothetical protein ACFL43_00705 [Thermodesulfobacteriota bacterium]
MKKEAYEKPEIRTEQIEMGTFGGYDPPSPQQVANPLFGTCCGS